MRHFLLIFKHCDIWWEIETSLLLQYYCCYHLLVTWVFVLKMALSTGPSLVFLSAASTNEGPCASFSNSARMPLIFLMGIYVKKKIYEPQRTRRRRKNKDLLCCLLLSLVIEMLVQKLKNSCKLPWLVCT